MVFWVLFFVGLGITAYTKHKLEGYTDYCCGIERYGIKTEAFMYFLAAASIVLTCSIFDAWLINCIMLVDDIEKYMMCFAVLLPFSYGLCYISAGLYFFGRRFSETFFWGVFLISVFGWFIIIHKYYQNYVPIH